MSDQKSIGREESNDKAQGEGNYDATRRFDKAQEKFVHDRKSEIPGMAKDAENALEGPQGDDLRKAEEDARAKAKR